MNDKSFGIVKRSRELLLPEDNGTADWKAASSNGRCAVRRASRNRRAPSTDRNDTLSPSREIDRSRRLARTSRRLCVRHTSAIRGKQNGPFVMYFFFFFSSPV